MIDREKVFKGLTCHVHGNPQTRCHKCPYWGTGPHGLSQCSQLFADALALLNALLEAQEPITGETSDGYHTFNELYHHRAVLFSVVVANYPERAWKSKKHHDGTMYDGMFIVGIDTPGGQATYHYDIEPYWDMFECKVLDNAHEWDGHTPSEAIERIGKLKANEPRVMTLDEAWKHAELTPGKWSENAPVYIEYHHQRPMYIKWLDAEALHSWLEDDTTADYNKATKFGWRCWTSRPTDEQREATPWD